MSVVERELATLKKFFERKLEVPLEVPDWITDHTLQHWRENDFSAHYLPKFTLREHAHLPLWQDQPEKIFYDKIREGILPADAATLPGKWILIDSRDKPAKKVPWIRSDNVWLLEKIGLRPKQFFQTWSRQAHGNDYLRDSLLEKGYGSRFCMNIHEIRELYPFILHRLRVDSNKTIRLPYFAEYNYLGNTVYPQWRTTTTWEWLEDTLEDGRHLASGRGSVGVLGFDPPNFWSTILTFRPVVEL